MTDEEVQPEGTDPLLEKMQIRKLLNHGMATHSMEEFICTPFMFMNAKEIWGAVRETYSNLENSSHVLELKKKLWFSRHVFGSTLDLLG